MLIELPIGKRIVDEREVLDTALFNTDMIVSVSVDWDNAIWEYGADPRSSGLCRLVYNGPEGPETHTIYLSLEEVMDVLDDREPLDVPIDTHGGPMPEKHGAFYDLATSEEISLRAGEFHLIPLGISIEEPKGYDLEIKLYSSMAFGYGILYTGSFYVLTDKNILSLPVLATRDARIPKGLVIAGMTFRKEVAVELEQVPLSEWSQ